MKTISSSESTSPNSQKEFFPNQFERELAVINGYGINLFPYQQELEMIHLFFFMKLKKKIPLHLGLNQNTSGIAAQCTDVTYH